MEKIIVKVSSSRDIARQPLSINEQTAQVRYNNQVITVHHVGCYGRYSRDAWLSEEMYQDFLQNGDPWLNEMLAECDSSSCTADETIPAFFQALAQHAASSERGQKALRCKDEMLSDHRIVRVPVWSGHATCTARQDLPDYGIIAGEMFHLLESGYSDPQGGSYAYIVADGCSCKSYEFRHQCDHRSEASQYNLARYEAQVWHKEDEPVHVAESIEQGDFEVADLPIVLVDADDEWALVLQNGQELTVRVSELDEQIGDFEEVYSVADFEEAKSDMMRFEREAYAILKQEAERNRKENAPLQPSGHVVEEFEHGAILMRAS